MRPRKLLIWQKEKEVLDMAILLKEHTKVMVQGLGKEGQFHAERMLACDTKVVAGVRPGKAGQDVLGIPCFNTVQDAKDATGANASIIFVPSPFAVGYSLSPR